MKIQTSGNLYSTQRHPMQVMAPIKIETEQQQQEYIDRFCEVLDPPDSHVQTDDDFERHFGNIEEIEHQVDLENLQQEEA